MKNDDYLKLLDKKDATINELRKKIDYLYEYLDLMDGLCGEYKLNEIFNKEKKKYYLTEMHYLEKEIWGEVITERL